eukprot:TRINITY_DN6336_c1_g3_i1.p1 TRINITY_DN6336_c1_g3~~TRINITY_DN6336_c1_g3_i1.p1  ORF type:complete len:133 (+),score=6.22 TRINITY_DN6336_c1_g3_i1:327-725(+)
MNPIPVLTPHPSFPSLVDPSLIPKSAQKIPKSVQFSLPALDSPKLSLILDELGWSNNMDQHSTLRITSKFTEKWSSSYHSTTRITSKGLWWTSRNTPPQGSHQSDFFPKKCKHFRSHMLVSKTHFTSRITSN